MSERVRDKSEAADGDVAVVKKYANRRLYNTATSSYVTLDELSQMVRLGKDFVVFDAKTGEDITRSVLTQIILEEDGKGRNLLPISFLRRIIGFYDDSLHALVPRYLEVSMENFARHQDQMRDYVDETFSRFLPVKPSAGMVPFETMARQNLAMFQNAARMLTPFTEPAATRDETDGEEDAAPALSAKVRELENQLTQLQRQLDEINERER